MSVYNVIRHSRIDCDKHAETSSSTILTTPDRESAYNVAANEWMESYIEHAYPELEDMHGYNEIREALSGGASGEEIHELFQNMVWDIYEPEYINEPTFEVSVEAEEVAVDRQSLNEEYVARFLDSEESE